jgi:hypothetical protein
MRHRPHNHKCENFSRGCKEKVPCNGYPERDEDGMAYCEYEGDHMWCEECHDAPSCEDCGALEHLKEAHEDSCTFHPLQKDDSLVAKFRLEHDVVEIKRESVA